jgi:hypothetical protein
VFHEARQRRTDPLVMDMNCCSPKTPCEPRVRFQQGLCTSHLFHSCEVQVAFGTELTTPISGRVFGKTNTSDDSVSSSEGTDDSALSSDKGIRHLPWQDQSLYPFWFFESVGLTILRERFATYDSSK